MDFHQANTHHKLASPPFPVVVAKEILQMYLNLDVSTYQTPQFQQSPPRSNRQTSSGYPVRPPVDCS